MTDRDKMLELLDEFKNSIVKLMDERETLESEAEELRSSKREAEEKAWAAEEKVKELTNKLEETKAELSSANEEISGLSTKAEQAEAGMSEAQEALQRERDELRKEMDEINAQLGRVSELYREASAEKEALEEKVDVSDLLAIYITLIETVFYGKPHARILYTLHDVKSAITRKNIASSTGIMPAAVLKAVHDLAAADLVSYDDETQEVELTKDIFRS